jgi:hypothetical protein
MTAHNTALIAENTAVGRSAIQDTSPCARYAAALLHELDQQAVYVVG